MPDWLDKLKRNNPLFSLRVFPKKTTKHSHLDKKWVKFPDFILLNYMLGDLLVMMCTMGYAYGSSNEILSEWDPGPTYLVQRPQDPGGPNYMSRSCFLVDLKKLGKMKCYLDYFHLLVLPSHPFLVILVLILVPKLQLGKLDHMGSFRYTPRL